MNARGNHQAGGGGHIPWAFHLDTAAHLPLTGDQHPLRRELAKWLGWANGATLLLVAVWFAVFSLPIFLWVREDKSQASPAGSPASSEGGAGRRCRSHPGCAIADNTGAGCKDACSRTASNG